MSSRPDKWIELESGVAVPFEGDPLEWARWFEEASRIVAKTRIGDLEVSTVFLGIDHNWCFAGPPLLYETMIFPIGDVRSALELQWRYSTREAAEEGHAQIVAALESGASPEALDSLELEP